MAVYRKPARWLGYPPRTIASWRAEGFRRVHIDCVGPDEGPRCRHQATLLLEALPALSWYDACARMRCTHCRSLGYVHLQPGWSDVIDVSTAKARVSGQFRQNESC